MLTKEIELTNENIELSIKNNVLDRNRKLVMLSKMISNINENVILSIDGKWGSGKTVFVKQFKYLIEHIWNINKWETLVFLYKIKENEKYHFGKNGIFFQKIKKNDQKWGYFCKK